MAGPFLSSITSTFFVSLINRLGVRPPPPDGFDLINTVQPVSLVDTDIALSAVTTTQLLDTPFTAGLLVAPGAGTVLADTGAQAIGNYDVYVVWAASDTVNATQIRLARRNAANAADIWAQDFFMNNSNAASGQQNYQLSLRLQLALNERLRLTNVNVGGAGSLYQASIWLVPA